MTADSLRTRLRSLPVFPEEIPDALHSEQVSDPMALFARWLDDAIEAGQPAPHAAVLATSRHNVPNARVILLKDMDADGWYFATHVSSPTGIDLWDSPFAALTFFWPFLGRQVRVSGPVLPTSPGASASDFLARPLASREATLIGRQSQVLVDPSDYDAATESVRRVLEADPAAVDPEWALYLCAARTVEFWRASADRRHARLRFSRRSGGWTAEHLWP
ncbi:pyridoxal 5'-phosphate synthase [Lysobacter korlensis]|uniref:Pyridoxal 5'-phosphate synthase n=1 Tax=Lysobacter korlensis TaxID=553636 RepID=A0ABV6RW79_9GAMM